MFGCLLILIIVVLSTHTSFVLSFSTLITFDVDGTLVSSSPGWEQGAHGRAFVHAVEKATSTNANQRTIPDLLDKHEFHGSTDGLILLRLARKMIKEEKALVAAAKEEVELNVNDMMDEMYNFVSKCNDEEVSKGIAPLPGVLDTLTTLASKYTNNENNSGRDCNNVACGLVTGNVEGIARRKMFALGIHDTGVFTPLLQPQAGRVWDGVEDIRFLGGFGSDYCSGSIDNPDRNYLDRGEQIAICVQRCLDLSSSPLDKVIHVGDAPSDIQAAKSYVNHPNKPPGLTVSCVGVATGTYSADELTKLCGERVEGIWEPIVLEQGQGVGNEEVFLKACGLI